MLAIINSQSNHVQTKIANLDVDLFEGIEQELVVSKRQIQYRLMLAGFSADGLKFSGPDQVAVSLKQRTDVRGLVETWLSNEISRTYSVPASDLQVKVNVQSDQLSVLGANLSALRLEQELKSELPLGNSVVEVGYESEPGKYETFKLQISVAVFRNLLVAKSSIGRGMKITGGHCRSRQTPGNKQERPIYLTRIRARQDGSDEYPTVHVDQTYGDSRKYDSAERCGETEFTGQRHYSTRPYCRYVKRRQSTRRRRRRKPIRLRNQKTKEEIVAEVVNANTATIR